MIVLHQNYVIHRDLKPGNILIDKDFYPHITDFGLSKFLDSVHSKSQSKSCGTPCYMAPEVIDGNHYDGKADVYSFGILMYQIVTDCRPYPLFDKGKIKEFRLNQKIVDENYRPTFNFPVKKALKKLIEKCWSKDPKNRPTFEEIFNRLAYNRECAIYDIFDYSKDGKDNEEESEDDSKDETPYYLDDVEVQDLFYYLDIITENVSTNRKSDDNSTTENLSQKVEKMQKMIEKVRKENSKKSDIISEQNERIEKLEKLVQKQKEQIKKQEKEIQIQKEQIEDQNIDNKNQIHKLNSQIIDLSKQVKEMMSKQTLNKASSQKKLKSSSSSDSDSMPKMQIKLDVRKNKNSNKNPSKSSLRESDSSSQDTTEPPEKNESLPKPLAKAAKVKRREMAKYRPQLVAKKKNDSSETPTPNKKLIGKRPKLRIKKVESENKQEQLLPVFSSLPPSSKYRRSPESSKNVHHQNTKGIKRAGSLDNFNKKKI